MRIQPIEMDIARILRGPDESPRSAGVHLSSIIRDISNSVLRPGQRQPFDTLSDAEKRRAGTYQSLGFAWERVLEQALCDQFACGSIMRPGEHHLDNIFCTPDPMDMENMTLEEWKCTWKSSAKAETPDLLEHNFREWFWQIKGYLKVLQLSVCNLRTYFVNGNYRDSGPQVKCWRLEFTQRELDDNWEMIRNHARSRGLIP